MELKDHFFVGREIESAELLGLLKKEKAELITVLGRRRIGKTFLVKNVYKNQINFHFTGIQNANIETHLQAFVQKLSEVSSSEYPIPTPKDWMEAFGLLKVYLKNLKSKKKKVIFLDEFSWMDTHKSGFLAAFEYFWNDWAVDQNIVVVICGSSTAWMIKNVLNNKSGLHNRITKYISLAPFTLKETKDFLKAKGINMPDYEVVQLFMAMGGVPYYLNEVRTGESAIQNIDRALFSDSSTLKNEFQNLYRALFDNYEKYELIIKALSTKQKGLTRKEIISATKISNGGGLSRMINELEESTFIRSILPFGKQKKEMLYRLIDEYSIFYFQFNPIKNIQGSFLKISTSPKYKAWAGFAFESVCLRHSNQIKRALGISGIFSEESSFFYKGDKNTEGFQIDLLIDRSDNCINICEMKFYSNDFELNSKEAEILRKRREQFRELSKTKKYLMNTFISTYPPKANASNMTYIDKIVLMGDLMK